MAVVRSKAVETHAAVTGEKYVKQEVRKGILPSILAALMNARAATRAALKEVSPDQPGKRAVLDSRQKALKLTANALYGFTGAQASPLQCVPLADSCLAMGCQVNTKCPTHCFLPQHLQVSSNARGVP